MSKKSIAVLGGGIMGLMSAYLLRVQGHEVTLYDPRGVPAEGNASWIAGGMLAPYSEIEHMDMAWVEAGIESIALWSKLPFACGFSQEGSLLIAHSEDRYILERFRAHLPHSLQELSTVRDVEPMLGDHFPKGVLLSEEAHIEPHRAMGALVQALKDLGVRCIAEARAPEDMGEAYTYCIDCRGMDAGDTELRGVKGEIVLVRNPEFSLKRPVRLMHPRYPLYIVPRPDHVFMIGASVIESEDGEYASLRSSMELMSALYSLHPSFGEAQLLNVLAGVRPSYPDNLPRISVDRHIIRANGLFRHGYLLAPIMADAIKDFIEGREHKYWSLLRKEA